MGNENHNSLPELAKLQFDYAWKWFNFHADQRVKMFNFMLLVFGIFSGAIVTAINNKLWLVSIVLCVVASILALIFSRLDRRNEELVVIGEDLLAKLETDIFFGNNHVFSARGKSNLTLGLITRKDADDKNCNTTFQEAIRGRHRFWLRGVAYLFILLFILTLLYSLYMMFFWRTPSTILC